MQCENEVICEVTGNEELCEDEAWLKMKTLLSAANEKCENKKS